MIFEQADAPLDESLLMFGASSGYTMLKYLRRLFRRCVFVHSAGHVDPALVRHEQPGALLLQSNGRFLVEPPRTDFDTRGRVAAKLAEASEAVRAHVQTLLQAGPAGAAMHPTSRCSGPAHEPSAATPRRSRRGLAGAGGLRRRLRTPHPPSRALPPLVAPGTWAVIGSSSAAGAGASDGHAWVVQLQSTVRAVACRSATWPMAGRPPTRACLRAPRRWSAGRRRMRRSTSTLH
jgi:hypothetical protein